MSGFLHQLAARSLGLAPEVRPRAALPYAAPAMTTLAAENSALQPAPASLTPEAQPPGSTAAKAPGGNFKPENALPTPLLAERSANNPASDRAGNAGSPATSAENEELRASPSPVPHLASPQTGIQAGQRDDKTSPVSAPAAAIYLRPEPAPGQDSQPGENSEPSRIADLENLVSRLLKQETTRSATPPDSKPSPSSGTAQPTSQRPAPVSTSRPAASRERPSVTATDPNPEVHITIGRLEVNPPSRPAPPPAPRPRGPAPLSLSDYLAQRNGGRS